ncbi:MAG: AzlC family ABC transporter permease [Lachnospiraceae bacterium]|nr:AzlC family ABC transporter permease [Lachnospiraceae bacterium]
MNEIKYAAKISFPILCAYVFLGIAYGVMMTSAGYSPLWSILSSIVIYAGSGQILMVSLLKAGTPLLSVAVMTFFINARHLFYGLGMIERYRTMGWRYPYMVFSMTDETYSILCSVEHPAGINRVRADFLIALFDHSYWILGSAIGSIAGTLFAENLSGIEFSATAFFLVVVVDQWRKFPSRIPVMTGILSAVVFYFLLGPDQMLIPALSASLVVLVILRDRVQYQLKKRQDEIYRTHREVSHE